MKDVLIVSYLFPPFNQIGAKRAYFFTKYLSKLGYRVQVLSSELPEVYSKWDADTSGLTIYRLPVRNQNLIRYDERAVLARFYQVCNDLYAPIDSKARIAFGDIDFEKITAPDIILATGGPWHSLEIGAKLKEKWPKSKLILDYRDAWNIFNPAVSIDSLNNFGKGLGTLKRKKFFRAEKEIIQQADAAIGVTQPILDNVINNPRFIFQKQFKSKVIYNGFEDLDVEPSLNREEFAICYTGILRQEQEHELFLAGFEQFMDTIPEKIEKVKLVFVGSDHARLQHLLAPFKASKYANRIEITPFVDRRTARAYQAQATLFLNFSYTGKMGVLSGKIFEYLELKKPMLIVSKNEDEMEKLLRKTNTGDIGKSPHGIAAILSRKFREWEAGKVIYEPNLEGMDFFKNEFQISRLADFMESL